MKLIKNIIIGMAVIGLVSQSCYAEDSRLCDTSPNQDLDRQSCVYYKIISAKNDLSMDVKASSNRLHAFSPASHAHNLASSEAQTDWSVNVASVMLVSKSDPGELSKANLDSRLTPDSNLYKEVGSIEGVSGNGISGSLLVSILALIAIVAVARRNITESTD